MLTQIIKFFSNQMKYKEILKNLEKANEYLNQKNFKLMKEINRRKTLERKLKKNATHDHLTGLPNRLLLKDRLNQAILRSKREGSIFGILFIDLDRLKPINDAFGHEVGDKVLQVLANRLKQTLRAEDTVSRIGGDEFVVLISHLSDENDVYPIAEKVMKNLSVPYQVNADSLTCTVSMGIAIFPRGGLTSRELIRNADMAMYQAKNEGGARFTFYSPQGS